MSGKFKILFGEFFKVLRQLWLEFIGGMFLVMGLVFGLAAIQEYRKYLHSPEVGTGRFILVLVSSGVMLFFALESFWKSRKHR
jgi:hypothetical protein